MYNCVYASQFLPLYEDYARGVGLPSERDGDTWRKLENIKTPKEANLGVAQALFGP